METGLRQEPAIRQLPSISSRRIDTASIPRSTTASDKSDETKTRQREAEVTREEQRIIRELAARDREVRAHEQAHLNVGREYVVSGPSYTYQQGPDGRNYAIGGEVTLDTSEEEKPQATLDKAETVRRAALAPAEPSPQDRQVASQAAQMAARARLEIAIERRNAQQEEVTARRDPRAERFTSQPPAEPVQVNVYV